MSDHIHERCPKCGGGIHGNVWGGDGNLVTCVSCDWATIEHEPKQEEDGHDGSRWSRWRIEAADYPRTPEMERELADRMAEIEALVAAGRHVDRIEAATAKPSFWQRLLSRLRKGGA